MLIYGKKWWHDTVKSMSREIAVRSGLKVKTEIRMKSAYVAFPILGAQCKCAYYFIPAILLPPSGKLQREWLWRSQHITARKGAIRRRRRLDWWQIHSSDGLGSIPKIPAWIAQICNPAQQRTQNRPGDQEANVLGSGLEVGTVFASGVDPVDEKRWVVIRNNAP